MDHDGPECCAFVRPNIMRRLQELSLHENKEKCEAIPIIFLKKPIVNIYGELYSYKTE